MSKRGYFSLIYHPEEITGAAGSHSRLPQSHYCLFLPQQPHENQLCPVLPNTQNTPPCLGGAGHRGKMTFLSRVTLRGLALFTMFDPPSNLRKGTIPKQGSPESNQKKAYML